MGVIVAVLTAIFFVVGGQVAIVLYASLAAFFAGGIAQIILRKLKVS